MRMLSGSANPPSMLTTASVPATVRRTAAGSFAFPAITVSRGSVPVSLAGVRASTRSSWPAASALPTSAEPTVPVAPNIANFMPWNV